MLTLLQIVAMATIATAATAQLTVKVSSTGTYAVSVGSTAWFKSGATSYTTGGKLKSTADGSLKLDGAPATGSGSDASGAFKSTTLSWDGGKYLTSFRQYAEMVVFEQAFPQGVSGTTIAPADPMSVRDDVSSSFPSFSDSGSTEELGIVQWTGDMTGNNFKHRRFTGKLDGESYSTGVRGFGPAWMCVRRRRAAYGCCLL